jgi:hypothetical protein
MYDVHDVHDLDRSGAGPISSPIHKKIIFFNFYFFEISKRLPERAHPGESKNALRVVGGEWGAELRTSASREKTTRSSCISLILCMILYTYRYDNGCVVSY